LHAHAHVNCRRDCLDNRLPDARRDADGHRDPFANSRTHREPLADIAAERTRKWWR
jgi:hypothetical protein